MTVTTRDIAISDILPSPNFSRSVYEKTAMESLKKSIADYGLLQAVGLAPSAEHSGKYDLVYGHRRFRAYLDLDRKAIPARIVSQSPLTENDRMRMNVIENNERQAVTLIESGLRWRRLVESGRYTVKELSYIEGVDEKKIQNSIFMYSKIPAKYLPNIVDDDPREDQKFLITQSKAHAIVNAVKKDGVFQYISDLFEMVRHDNASVKEIREVAQYIQTGDSPKEALAHVRKVNSRVTSKTLTFKVKRKRWDELKAEFGNNISDVVATAIKKRDNKLLERVALVLG